MNLKQIDDFFGKMASIIWYIILVSGLLIFGAYCNWEYLKAVDKEAIKEVQNEKK